jgi:maternal-effect protein exuperantia
MDGFHGYNYCSYMAGYWKMVSTTVKENGVEGGEVSGLPPGDYSLIGWDVDTTGRRLLDEIFQIAAFSPEVSFSQYVMPFRDLNPAARRRHNIRVVTVGRYRMLKDSRTGKVSCADHITVSTGDIAHVLLLI